jgi:predicted TPR repeat methyltransferase
LVIESGGIGSQVQVDESSSAVVGRHVRVPTKASVAYVSQEFDAFAPFFDEKLVKRLGYRGPELVKVALGKILTDTEKSLAALRWLIVDFGAGTGLCGSVLRSLARWLVGVDLSSGMLEQVLTKPQRAGYDALVQGGVAWLSAEERKEAVNLIVSMDVLVYLGDLRPFFSAAATALVPPRRTMTEGVSGGQPPAPNAKTTIRQPIRKDALVRKSAIQNVTATSDPQWSDALPSRKQREGGILITLVESLEVSEHRSANRRKVHAANSGPGWELLLSGRYGHTKAYVQSTAEECGLTLELLERIVVRFEYGRAVNGYLIAFRRRSP